MRPARAHATAILLALASLPSFADTSVIGGSETWRIVLTPRGGKFVHYDALSSFSNECYSQEIIARGPARIVIVRTNNLGPFASSAALADAPRLYVRDEALKANLAMPASRAIRNLAETLSRGVETQVEYVDKVMLYVRERVEWAEVDDNDSLSVFRSGRGTCAGFCSLAIDLLRAEGIPARHSVVQTLKHPSWEAGAHAEVEVYYADSGWVSYDPQAYFHHSPYPRIWLGSLDGSKDGLVYSSSKAAYAACVFFLRNDYDVRYELVSSDVRVLTVSPEPDGWACLSRDDGGFADIPVVAGTIYDGSGKPSTLEYVYAQVDGGEKSVEPVALSSGSFAIANDGDGGFLYFDEGGWCIFWRFPGDAGRIVHDIYWDERDSIIVRGRPGQTVRWFATATEVYGFKVGPDGILRLHVDDGPGRYRVDDAYWRKTKDGWKRER